MELWGGDYFVNICLRGDDFVTIYIIRHVEKTCFKSARLKEEAE